MAALTSSCLRCSTSKPWHPIPLPFLGSLTTNLKTGPKKSYPFCSRFTVFAVTEGSAKKSKPGEEEKKPSWANPDSDEPPPWARNEAQKASSGDFPFGVYLLASAITAIAAIGSIFEYVNQKPVFGVVAPDSAFYAPLLGFFVFTGFPTAGYLWYKSVQVANKEAEEQDRMDGYR